MTKIAIVTGVTGQDGSYLAEQLLSRDYRVVGTVRDIDRADFKNIDGVCNNLELVQLDLLDQSGLEALLRKLRPHEFYNLAAQSSGVASLKQPLLTIRCNGWAVLRQLEAVRNFSPLTRYCQASSSEIFGQVDLAPQTEATPLNPQNPYGAAKALAHWAVGFYRQRYRLFGASAILYNHESPRRGQEFVSRKISRGAAAIKLGLDDKLRLGNLSARRDWGFASDSMRALRLMLQQPVAADYIVATGQTHSVRELCQTAFTHLGLNYCDYVVHDSENFRTEQQGELVGNPDKLTKLGWRPTLTFSRLITAMVDADLRALQGLASGDQESTF